MAAKRADQVCFGWAFSNSILKSSCHGNESRAVKSPSTKNGDEGPYCRRKQFEFNQQHSLVAICRSFMTQ
jgi:hypothetical protein